LEGILTLRAIWILSLVLFMAFVSIAPAHAASTLRSDLPFYTLRDAQITLLGSGLSNQPYYIWEKGPGDNRTTYTGISFTPVSGGYIPPSIGLVITPQSTLGTYTVSLSTSPNADNSQAVTHFGIWGTIRPLYQRTETARVVGGGLFPGSSLKLSIRNPAGNYIVTSTIVVTSDGSFNYSYRIPVNAVTETYKIIIDGTGTFDTAQQDYISESRFSVTTAVLSPKFESLPSRSYQRTEVAKASLGLSYPDGSPVVSIVPNIHPIVLLQNQSTVGFATLALVDQSNGLWGVGEKLPVNATINSRYRFELLAMSFDDGFGNKGGTNDVYSDYFKVDNASLQIASSINGTQVQIPFGQVSIISKVLYPDGTPLTSNGTVRVTVTTGPSISMITLTYDPGLGAWHGSYSSSFSDLWRVGTWTLKVDARDRFGNTGTTSYKVSAQPYLVLGIIGIITFIMLAGRWVYVHYGRKVYFRLRKEIRRFRRPERNL
jgi:hypothetical protein